ncbi:hypothetical protein [Leadbettera azotonutricia]|uniref:Uncharacterized protein n=1 Tax=Leadbettera azotonutricia (strain ATCC BAA-888 / DSM 13862 / ZAS-9) TaxID=545695 RepID=F5YD11_LEAAZ|nr:hypothetical protein [Leadbettera azotonutricia]AEF81501.1 hypothetical protein TREAZ_2805 [Leadbettera azotonutricia ZAS-9]
MPFLAWLVIALGISTTSSMVVNILQWIDNKNLRKQIEQLLKIIKNLENEVSELKKQMHALKIWHFRHRYELRKAISLKNRSIKENMEKVEQLKKNQITLASV